MKTARPFSDGPEDYDAFLDYFQRFEQPHAVFCSLQINVFAFAFADFPNNFAVLSQELPSFRVQSGNTLLYLSAKLNTPLYKPVEPFVLRPLLLEAPFGQLRDDHIQYFFVIHFFTSRVLHTQ
jgi:hypothetical protein